MGGGGGSGGRLVMNKVKNYRYESYMLVDYHNSNFIYAGGRGDQSIHISFTNGEEGTVMLSKCLPGYSGILCSPCQIGTFKSDFSHSECLPCENKPENSYYIREAEDTSLCSY